MAEFTTQNGFSPMWDQHANAQMHYTSGAVRLVASWVPVTEGLPAAPPIPPQYVQSEREMKESQDE